MYYSINSPTPLVAEERKREENEIVNGIYIVIISLWCMICVALMIDIYKSYNQKFMNRTL